MIGGSEAVFAAEVELTPSIREKAWSRPPIQVHTDAFGEGPRCGSTVTFVTSAQCLLSDQRQVETLLLANLRLWCVYMFLLCFGRAVIT